MSQNTIVIVHKEPIVERIPNLKSLIEYLAENGVSVVLISSHNKKFPAPFFLSRNIEVFNVAERTRALELPTILKIIFSLFLVIIKSKKRITWLCFAGKGGLAILGSLSFLFRLRYKLASFVVEYPDIFEEKRACVYDFLEFRGIEVSDFFVTHDLHHASLINQRFSKCFPEVFFLPNAVYKKREDGDQVERTYLHHKTGISIDKKIILHSGGFGAWFSSKELALQSRNLADDEVLVFHTSHNIQDDEYYKECKPHFDSLYSLVFSTEPVSTDQLDSLVSSAYIGVAWYNTEVLGFRAIHMGFAAGKIGSYLKSGIPVIAPRLKSLSYIEECGAGVLIDSLDDLRFAIDMISREYDSYRINSSRCYSLLWDPTSFLLKIKNRIND